MQHSGSGGRVHLSGAVHALDIDVVTKPRERLIRLWQAPIRPKEGVDQPGSNRTLRLGLNSLDEFRWRIAHGLLWSNSGSIIDDQPAYSSWLPWEDLPLLDVNNKKK